MPEPREGLELCHQEGGAEMKNLTHSAQLCEATPSATSHTTPKERTPARRCPVSAPLFHDVTGSSPSPRQKQAPDRVGTSTRGSAPVNKVPKAHSRQLPVCCACTANVNYWDFRMLPRSDKMGWFCRQNPPWVSRL
ncbi:hypothetical protein LEMLEM_LOCUS11486 [Lemmus lemmus]